MTYAISSFPHFRGKLDQQRARHDRIINSFRGPIESRSRGRAAANFLACSKARIKLLVRECVVDSIACKCCARTGHATDKYTRRFNYRRRATLCSSVRKTPRIQLRRKIYICMYTCVCERTEGSNRLHRKKSTRHAIKRRLFERGRLSRETT